MEVTVLCLVSHVLNFFLFCEHFFWIFLMFDLKEIPLWKLRFAGNEPLMDREKQGFRVYTNGCVRLNLRICEIPSSGPAPCRAGILHHDQRIAVITTVMINEAIMTGAFHASSTGLTRGFLKKPGKQTMPGSEPWGRDFVRELFKSDRTYMCHI